MSEREMTEEECHERVRAANERLGKARAASGRHPLDLLSPPTQEEEEAEREVNAAHEALCRVLGPAGKTGFSEV